MISRRLRTVLEKLGPGGSTLVIGMAIVNLSNFAFHVLVSRLLGPGGYGELGSFLNLILVLSVGVGALQAAFTQSAAHLDGAHSEFSLATSLIKTVFVGLLAGVALVGVHGQIESFLHVHSAILVMELAIWIPLSLVGSVLLGVLMGRMRFGLVALALIAGTGVGRVLFGVLLVKLGFGVAGAFAGSIIGQVMTTVILFVPLGSSTFRRRGRELSVHLGDGFRSVAALSGFWLLASEDTILARHFLAAREAGLYASGATAGRIAMFLPGAIAMIAFPKFAADNGRGEGARTTLRWSLALTAGVGLLAALVLATVPSLVVSVLFGAQYSGAVDVVRILGLEACLLGLSSLLTYYQLARRSMWSLAPWGAAVLAGLLVVVLHSSAVALATIMLASTALLTLALLISAAHMLLRDPLMPELPSLEGPRTSGDSDIDLTLVVPFYNPGPRLVEHIGAISDVLASRNIAFEIIAVSDGSTDGSAQLLKDCYVGGLTCVELPKNFGKGQALRVGLNRGRGNFVGFIDADGDIPATLLQGFIDVISAGNVDIVAGSKRHPDSNVYYPPLRRIYSWGYQQFISIFFRVGVSDTQTGIKLMRRDVVAEVLPRMVEKRFAFDLEFFVVARHLGYRNVAELPITIQRRFTSTVNMKAVQGMLMDTLGIFYRLHFVHFYDPPSQARLGETVSIARLEA